MEMVIIFSTITAFFCHYFLDRAVVANGVSAIAATLLTWVLAGTDERVYSSAFLQEMSITAVIAMVVSMLVGLIFREHRKCAK